MEESEQFSEVHHIASHNIQLLNVHVQKSKLCLKTTKCSCFFLFSIHKHGAVFILGLSLSVQFSICTLWFSTGTPSRCGPVCAVETDEEENVGVIYSHSPFTTYYAPSKRPCLLCKVCHMQLGFLATQKHKLHSS